MTKAEILAAIRYLVNEANTDVGALLSDTGNLQDFAYDAAEQVVTDLLPQMPHMFLTTELVSLAANDEDYDLANEFLQIFKVERNVAGKSPKEIPIIDPERKLFYAKVGETAAEPAAVYFQGKTMFVLPKPTTTVSNYFKIYEVVPEAAAIPTNGPTYIPRVAHRLIVYWAAYLAATSVGVDPTRYLVLYQKRLAQIVKTWRDRYHQEPQFVRESKNDRTVYDDREPYYYDKDWPD